MPALVIRTATRADAAAINRIYNHYIRRSIVTFDVQPWSAQRRATWLDEFIHAGPRNAGQHHVDQHHANRYHALVAEQDGAVVGFASNGPFRPKAAYHLSTETTIYTAPHNQSRGIGTELYKTLFQRIGDTDLHRAYAVIALPNPRSIEFHHRFGFTAIGTLHQVGHKFDRHIDTTWFEKKLK